jgi:hypothetical protein
MMFKWWWCELCNCACIKCETCGSLSCTGHSEECCHQLFDEAIKESHNVKITDIPPERLIKDEMKALLEKELADPCS